MRASSTTIRLCLGLLIAVILALLLPLAAGAQSKSTAQQLESIRARMETGLGLFVSGQHAKAAAEFDAGYAEHPYSAFLFNAGVCYQKLGEHDKALARYREYLRVDPEAPDIDKVQERIAALEAMRATAPPPPGPDAGPAADGGVAAAPPPPPASPPPADDKDAMRSLVVVETEPPGAPIRIYRAANDKTPPYVLGEPNPSWQELYATVAPTSLSLSVGRYHVVVEKFRDFNVSETDIRVLAGHVHHFKANLSQGAFMAFLRVSANIKGAHVWLDDPKKEKPEWGTTPYAELVPTGEHSLLVEAPGFQPLTTKVTLEHGEQKEVEVRLQRVDYGYVRLDANIGKVSVRLDEKPVGVWRSGEDPLQFKAAAGKHQLVVEGDGYKTLDAIIEVPKGQVLPVHAKMIPTYPRGAAWTQAVLAAAFIGAGAFFGTESNKLQDQLEADRRAGVLGSDDGRILRGRLYAIGADVGFGVGAVLAVLSTYNFIKDPLPDSAHAEGKPAEFGDDVEQKQTSRRPPRSSAHAAPGDARGSSPAGEWSAGASVTESGGGFVLRRSF